jgi:hypothetical protein
MDPHGLHEVEEAKKINAAIDVENVDLLRQLLAPPRRDVGVTDEMVRNGLFRLATHDFTPQACAVCCARA